MSSFPVLFEELSLSAIHNGTYTIRNKTTGEHRTLKIHTQAPDARFAPGARIVSLLTGSSNEKDYTGFGFLSDDGIRIWKRYRGNGHRTAHEWYAKMLWDFLANHGQEFGDRYDCLCERRCRICNRKLTTPESIELGIGPVCLALRGVR